MMKTNNMEVESFILVNSKGYHLKKIAGYVFVALSILIGGAVFARGSGGNFLSLFIEIPFWQELILYIIVFFLFVFGIALQFNHEDRKGEAQFLVDILNLDGKEISLANTPVTVSLNASPGKGVYGRTIKDSGGNNWIEFVQNGEPKKYEFLIPSQKKEEELTGMIDEYRKKGFKVELKSSLPSFWEKLSF